MLVGRLCLASGKCLPDDVTHHRDPTIARSLAQTYQMEDRAVRCPSETAQTRRVSPWVRSAATAAATGTRICGKTFTRKNIELCHGDCCSLDAIAAARYLWAGGSQLLSGNSPRHAARQPSLPRRGLYISQNGVVRRRRLPRAAGHGRAAALARGDGRDGDRALAGRLRPVWGRLLLAAAAPAGTPRRGLRAALRPARDFCEARRAAAVAAAHWRGTGAPPARSWRT